MASLPSEFLATADAVAHRPESDSAKTFLDSGLDELEEEERRLWAEERRLFERWMTSLDGDDFNLQQRLYGQLEAVQERRAAVQSKIDAQAIEKH